MVRRFLFLYVISAVVLGCPDHNALLSGHGLDKRSRETKDWEYDASYNWGSINKSNDMNTSDELSRPNLIFTEYALCQTGTQQSPIPLEPSHGLAVNIGQLQFSYPETTLGMLNNWGYGPAFTVNTSNECRPSISFVNETVYLKGWHIHAPSDHRVWGEHSKAELHLVHANAEGHERAVVSIRINPGVETSRFFAQFPEFPGYDSERSLEMEVDILQAVKEVQMFSHFWSYTGSLTSPPCTEGIRWFVARDILYTSGSQMQELLRVSKYSARVQQDVWQHYIHS